MFSLILLIGGRSLKLWVFKQSKYIDIWWLANVIAVLKNGLKHNITSLNSVVGLLNQIQENFPKDPLIVEKLTLIKRHEMFLMPLYCCCSLVTLQCCCGCTHFTSHNWKDFYNIMSVFLTV